MMFFVGLIHQVFAYMSADGRIENLFFHRGMELQLRQRLLHNLFSGLPIFRFLELLKKLLDVVVIGLQEIDGVGVGRASVDVKKIKHEMPPEFGG